MSSSDGVSAFALCRTCCLIWLYGFRVCFDSFVLNALIKPTRSANGRSSLLSSSSLAVAFDIRCSTTSFVGLLFLLLLSFLLLLLLLFLLILSFLFLLSLLFL